MTGHVTQYTRGGICKGYNNMMVPRFPYSTRGTTSTRVLPYLFFIIKNYHPTVVVLRC